MWLDQVQLDSPDAEVLGLRVAVWVVPEVGGGGEDGVLGRDGHEGGFAEQIGNGAGNTGGTNGGISEEASREDHDGRWMCNVANVVLYRLKEGCIYGVPR